MLQRHRIRSEGSGRFTAPGTKMTLLTCNQGGKDAQSCFSTWTPLHDQPARDERIDNHEAIVLIKAIGNLYPSKGTGKIHRMSRLHCFYQLLSYSHPVEGILNGVLTQPLLHCDFGCCPQLAHCRNLVLLPSQKSCESPNIRSINSFPTYVIKGLFLCLHKRALNDMSLILSWKITV